MSKQATSANELMKLEREILRMFLAGDVDQVMDNYIMENAMVCLPGMDRIVGRENQRVLFKELLTTEGVELSWEPIEAHVSPSEEMAYVYGSVRWKMPNEAEQHGKYISIWVKENGAWKNAVEIRNTNG
jgi:ketosteroid isomerase-like protein